MLRFIAFLHRSSRVTQPISLPPGSRRNVSLPRGTSRARASRDLVERGPKRMAKIFVDMNGNPS